MIYLIRHGAVDTGEEKRYIGWTDLPLSDTGLRQARQWRDELAGTAFGEIYCSDLERSRRTARIISDARPGKVRELSQLREINLGELESLAMSRVRRRYPDKWRDRGANLLSYRPVGGESFLDLRDRIVPVFEEIATVKPGNILIVAHAGVNRMILCHVLGMPLENMFHMAQDYACLNIIQKRNGSCRLIALNRCL